MRYLLAGLLTSVLMAALACSQQSTALPACDPTNPYFDMHAETHYIRADGRELAETMEVRFDGVDYHRIRTYADGDQMQLLRRGGETWRQNSTGEWESWFTSDSFGHAGICGPVLHASGHYIREGVVFRLVADVDLDGEKIRLYESVAPSDAVQGRAQLWVNDADYLVRALSEVYENGRTIEGVATFSGFGEPNVLPPLPIPTPSPRPVLTATPAATPTPWPLAFATRPTPTPVSGECACDGRIPEQEIYEAVLQNMVRSDDYLLETLDIALVEAGWVQSRGYWRAEGTVCGTDGGFWEKEWTGQWYSDCSVSSGGSSGSRGAAPPEKVCPRFPTPTPTPTPFPHICTFSFGTIDSTVGFSDPPKPKVHPQFNWSTGGFFIPQCRSALRPGSYSSHFTVDLRTPTAFKVRIRSEQEIHVYLLAGHRDGPVIAEGSAVSGTDLQTVLVQEEPLLGPHTIVVTTRHPGIEGRFDININDLNN